VCNFSRYNFKIASPLCDTRGPAQAVSENNPPVLGICCLAVPESLF
jgi:hypothetical protein